MQTYFRTCNSYYENIYSVSKGYRRTVCEWVTRTIRTVREVIERVCRSLPWPLSLLCDLVTKVIEVIENITEWICHEVIDRFFEWVQVFMEYIYYIARWICWLITWITVRWIEYLLCRGGIEISKNIRICVKVLSQNITDRRTGAVTVQPAATNAELVAMLNQASVVFRQCNINVIVDSIDIIGHPEFCELQLVILVILFQVFGSPSAGKPVHQKNYFR